MAVHSGDMGDMVGDEFLAVFPSASDAVPAALEMQRVMAEDNQSLPAGRRMQFRLGLHSGVLVVKLATEDLRQNLPYKDNETLDRFISNVKKAGLE